VIAVLDSGILWDFQDLVRKLYLNSRELPFPKGALRHDANGDGVFNIDDYAGDPRVGDGNGNGLLDPGDLIQAFSDRRDGDGNGYVDDICGYDFFATDNDPADDVRFRHGTGIASSAAAETDNAMGDSGVCPRCRILPVRVGDSFVVDANRFARGVVFAVEAGASVIGSALGSYNNTPAARTAVDLAYARGVPVVASAADEFSYHHNYPSLYGHALYVNSIRYNHADDFRKGTTFWGISPCTNYGARVSLTVPATSCSSGSTARLAGVAGLVVSAARDAGLAPLASEEVYQVLRASADDLDNSNPDWGAMRYPGRKGFDQFYGYGRVNVWQAVRAVEEGRIPPIADLAAPDWFAIVSPRATPQVAVTGSLRVPRAERATFALDYALGVEPAEDAFTRVAGGPVSGALEGTLGTLDFTALPLPAGPPPAGREDRDRYAVTVRLRLTDDRGLTAESRRSFFVFDDPARLPGFPRSLGASGEAAPVVTDLDGDERDEIVLGTADGVLRILSLRPSGLYEQRLDLDPGLPAPRGSAARLPGIDRFPLAARERHSLPARPGRPRRQGRPRDRGQRARRPRLRMARGRQARARLPRGRPRPQDRPAREARLLTRGGGSRRRWAARDRGGIERLAGGAGAAYALSSEGKLLPGWNPFEVPLLRGDLLPTLATGVQMSPVLVDADGDGDQEVVLYGVTGTGIFLLDPRPGTAPRTAARYSLSPGAGSALQGTSFLASPGSPLVADTDGDGAQELYAPLLPLRMLTMRTSPGVPLDVPPALGGWELRAKDASGNSVPMISSYPRRMEDLIILAAPVAADVDGDGGAEILLGTGGYFLHAFARGGGEAAGFPKFTGGWIFSPPAVGDLDGDGQRELVSVTREGNLFVWRLPATAPPAR
jgi:hypothetical protein